MVDYYYSQISHAYKTVDVKCSFLWKKNKGCAGGGGMKMHLFFWRKKKRCQVEKTNMHVQERRRKGVRERKRERDRPANQYDLVVFSTIFRSKYDSTIFLNKIRFFNQKTKQKNDFFYFLFFLIFFNFFLFY